MPETTDTAKELIARVRELDKAATPGPWCIESCGEKGDGSNIIGVAYGPDDPDCKTALSGWLKEWDDDGNEIEYYRDQQIAELEHRNNNPGDDAAFIAFSRAALPDLATLAEQAIARAEKAEADLAEARRMLKEAEHGRNDAEHDLVEGISYIRQTSRYVNDDRDCRAAWSWADDLQQRHDARVNGRHQAREGK